MMILSASQSSFLIATLETRSEADADTPARLDATSAKVAAEKDFMISK